MKFDHTYAADFETSVYSGQEATEVWSAGLVDLEAPNMASSVEFYDSLDGFMKRLLFMSDDGTETNVRIYFHNLKFDGSFILDYLMKDSRFIADTVEEGGVETLRRRKSVKSMGMFHYSYSVNRQGQWYAIRICSMMADIYIFDSLKIIPMSLKMMGKSFKTAHQKLEMEYTGERHAGHKLTDDERAYLANDVLVLKEALNIVFGMGMDGMTIGSICLAEFKELLPMGKSDYRTFFPDMTRVMFEGTGESVDDFCRRGYHGGWCYCREEGIEWDGPGYTFDVNSLYPSMMHSMSGNRYPVGYPKSFWGGPENARKGSFYYIRFKCEFHLKERHFPCVQIKNSMLYNPKQWLSTSDVCGHSNPVELTMCTPDYELFMESYDVTNIEYIGGVYFNTEIGVFDKYIDKWAKIKMESGDNKALRTIAKLFLNNLYGKLASSMDSSYKMAYFNEEEAIRFRDVEEYEKETGYIPIGAAITAYARCFTIRAATANYDDFLYADTDSIHCKGYPEEAIGVPEDPVKFCHWKNESCWDKAIFARQKTYIEHITTEDHEAVKPYWNVKCAGMGEGAKRNLASWLVNGKRPIPVDVHEDRTDVKYEEFSLSDFKRGLCVPGNLKAKRIKGGVLLSDNVYRMR